MSDKYSKLKNASSNLPGREATHGDRRRRRRRRKLAGGDQPEPCLAPVAADTGDGRGGERGGGTKWERRERERGWRVGGGEREERGERESGGERWRKKPRSAPGDPGGRNSVLFAALFCPVECLFFILFYKKKCLLFF